jgi:hypothetical protein
MSLLNIHLLPMPQAQSDIRKHVMQQQAKSLSGESTFVL